MHSLVITSLCLLSVFLLQAIKKFFMKFLKNEEFAAFASSWHFCFSILIGAVILILGAIISFDTTTWGGLFGLIFCVMSFVIFVSGVFIVFLSKRKPTNAKIHKKAKYYFTSFILGLILYIILLPIFFGILFLLILLSFVLQSF